MRNDYFKYLCPGNNGKCKKLLGSMPFSHYSLHSTECPDCGTVWRVFHKSNTEFVEFTPVFNHRLEDDPEAISIYHNPVRG
jgi:hypothetical protein